MMGESRRSFLIFINNDSAASVLQPVSVNKAGDVPAELLRRLLGQKRRASATATESICFQLRWDVLDSSVGGSCGSQAHVNTN